MNAEDRMAGEVTFELTEDDAVAATRDLLRERYGASNPVRQVRFGSSIFMLWLLLAWMIGAAMDWLFLDRSGAFALLPFGLAALLCLLLISDYFYRRVPAQARRLFRQRASRPTTYGWSKEGLSIRNRNGHGLVPWSDLYRWLPARHSFLFLTDELSFFVIPRSAVNEAQAKDLEATATAAGVPTSAQLEVQLTYA
jgi:hypothetical protein